jgi:putative redox protein
MIDKTKELYSSIELVNNKVHFTGKVDGNHPVSIDYTPPLGDNLGYTSLELLLLSVSSCLGTSILAFLRKMNKTIDSCEIRTKGLRHETHPTGFREIIMDIKIGSKDVNETDMNKVIEMSENTYCPLLAMIKGNVELKTTYIIQSK